MAQRRLRRVDSPSASTIALALARGAAQHRVHEAVTAAARALARSTDSATAAWSATPSMNRS